MSEIAATHRIAYQGCDIESRPDETVLDALLRAGIDTPFSCKGGSCLTCMLQCETGAIPTKAQNGLSAHLQKLRYFLPCRCVAESSMKLRGPRPDDLLNTCMLCEQTANSDGGMDCIFESTRTFKYRTGQTLRIVSGADVEAELRITSDPDRDFMLQGTIAAEQLAHLPAHLLNNPDFGVEFTVRGPFDAQPVAELDYPEPDPELWALLQNGKIARVVLEAFYDKVYADPVLAPFFENVTQSRAIDKQYSFMRQCIAGEKIYMGDRPRNAHHRMIISHEVFDHRQRLMEETWAEQGIDAAIVARWTAFEEYFRPDIVKSNIWPRVVGGQVVPAQGFTPEILGESSLCDHCQREVFAGETVVLDQWHGTISCTDCSVPAVTA